MNTKRGIAFFTSDSRPDLLDIIACGIIWFFEEDFFITSRLYILILCAIVVITTIIAETIKKRKGLILRGVRIGGIVCLICAMIFNITAINCKTETLIVPITGCGGYSTTDAISYQFYGRKCSSGINDLHRYGKNNEIINRYNAKIIYKRLYPHIYKPIGVKLIPKKNVYANIKKICKNNNNAL